MDANMTGKDVPRYTYRNSYGGYDVYFDGEWIKSFTTSSALTDAKAYCKRANNALNNPPDITKDAKR